MKSAKEDVINFFIIYKCMYMQYYMQCDLGSDMFQIIAATCDMIVPIKLTEVLYRVLNYYSLI
jgi:hypothetical protein